MSNLTFYLITIRLYRFQCGFPLDFLFQFGMLLTLFLSHNHMYGLAYPRILIYVVICLFLFYSCSHLPLCSVLFAFSFPSLPLLSPSLASLSPSLCLCRLSCLKGFKHMGHSIWFLMLGFFYSQPCSDSICAVGCLGIFLPRVKIIPL